MTKYSPTLGRWDISLNTCEICGKEGITVCIRLGRDIYFCKKCCHYYCGYADDPEPYSIYEEYGYSIKQLRLKNYRKILKKMHHIIPQNATGLEVGSGFGWFLQEAEKFGYSMYGIEPMEKNYNYSVQHNNCELINGFFPQDLPDNLCGKFDFIIFNDVFEHIPNLKNILTTCDNFLKPEGYLIINLPLNTGIMYKISMMLMKLGSFNFLKRLWQFETESPHLYYFSSKSLKKLVCSSGWNAVAEFGLSTVSAGFKSNYKRISGIGNIGKLKSLMLTVCVMVSAPFFKILPKDTKCFIYKK